jgi:hypothetical protein
MISVQQNFFLEMLVQKQITEMFSDKFTWQARNQKFDMYISQYDDFVNLEKYLSQKKST